MCVLKNKRDLEILLNENWYRIPVKHLPKRKFEYLAFYQPLAFGKEGKQIIYFAKITGRAILKRSEILPSEPDHPNANENYARYQVGKIHKLFRPIKNTIPRRVNFGFTTFKRLINARNILELYSIAPTEQILEEAMKKAGIKFEKQRWVSCGKKRFRLDFAIIQEENKIAIECDNETAHSGLAQKQKDKIKTKTLKNSGWTVLRFRENDIISRAETCIAKIKEAQWKLSKLAKKGQKT